MPKISCQKSKLTVCVTFSIALPVWPILALFDWFWLLLEDLNGSNEFWPTLWVFIKFDFIHKSQKSAVKSQNWQLWKKFFFSKFRRQFSNFLFLYSICFFWSLTSRFEPKINLEFKILTKLVRRVKFWYPPARVTLCWVICLRFEIWFFFT